MRDVKRRGRPAPELRDGWKPSQAWTPQESKHVAHVRAGNGRETGDDRWWRELQVTHGIEVAEARLEGRDWDLVQHAEGAVVGTPVPGRWGPFMFVVRDDPTPFEVLTRRPPGHTRPHPLEGWGDADDEAPFTE